MKQIICFEIILNVTSSNCTVGRDNSAACGINSLVTFSLIKSDSLLTFQELIFCAKFNFRGKISVKGSLNAAFFFSGVKSCTSVCLPFNICISRIIQFAKMNSSTVPALKMKQL